MTPHKTHTPNRTQTESLSLPLKKLQSGRNGLLSSGRNTKQTPLGVWGAP